MSIKIDNLSFGYVRGNQNVLKNISIEIPKGSVCLLLGLNGCGKTTLIKNIAGLLKPFEGSVFVDSNDVQAMNITKRSKVISYVSQRNENLSDVIIKDYLSFGFVNELKFYERPSFEQMKRVVDYSDRFGIKHLLDKTLDEISGGERQIVSICSAMLQNTEVILLDEPTSALDLTNQNKVLTVLYNLALLENKTIILSSHNPNHALFLNSNVALMKDGKISYYGLASEIVTIDKLKEVYGNNICYSEELPYKEISFKK